MRPEPISFAVGYDDKIIFHLRMISIEEEVQYNKRYADISDLAGDKADKEYQILVDCFADWSDKPPEIKVKGETIATPLVGDALASDAIRQFFKARTIENERLLNTAMIAFRNRLTPTVDFL